MTKIFAVLFFILVVVVGVSFSSLNSEPVTVNYYLGSLSVPLSVVVVVSFALGVVCAFVVTTVSLLGTKWQVSRLRRDVKAREQEILGLRKLPNKAS